MKPRPTFTIVVSLTVLLPVLAVLPAAAAGPTCAPPTLQAGSNSNPFVVNAKTNCTDSSSSITSTQIQWGEGPGAITNGTTGSFTYGGPEDGGIMGVIATDAAGSSTTVLESLNLTIPGFVKQGRAVQFQTGVDPIPGLNVNVTFTCVNADGPSGTQSLANYHLSCSFPNGQSSYPLALNGSGPSPSLQVTIQSDSTSSATMLRPTKPDKPVWLMYAAVLPIALLCFPVCLKSDCGNQMNVGRYIGLVAIIAIVPASLACGGSSSRTPLGSYTGNNQATLLVGFQVSQ